MWSDALVLWSLDVLWVLLLGLYLVDALVVCDPGEVVIVGWRPGAARVRRGLEVSLGRPRVIAWGGVLPPLDPPIVVGGGSLDADALVARHARTMAVLRPVRVLAQSLFVLVFLLLPGAILAPSGWYTPTSLFVVIGLCWTAVAVSTVRATGTVYAGDRERPSVAATLMSPISAIRVADVVTRSSLKDWHPVVVARHLCTRADYLALARTTCFAAAGPDVATLTAFLRSVGDWDAVQAPPDVEVGCRSFCPACHAQFREGADACPDCRVPLRAHQPAGTVPAGSLAV